MVHWQIHVALLDHEEVFALASLADEPVLMVIQVCNSKVKNVHHMHKNIK